MSLRNLSYLVSLVPGLLAIIGNMKGSYWTLSAAAFALVILGLVEWFAGKDRKNSHTENHDPFPEVILFLHVAVQTVVLVTFFLGIYHQILQDAWMFWAAFSTGVAAGIGGIVPAHELIHKANPVKQFLGKYLLMSCGNVYFFTHHLRIHHRHVATSHDSATARKGESLYAFMFRTIPGQYREAWQSEADMLRKKGQHAFSLGNVLWVQTLIQIMVLPVIFFSLGPVALSAWLLYVLVAHVLLEYVNYIEHYGLFRSPDERVSELHSWNSDSRVSRYLLVDLSRHADHHFYASKPYHTLQTYDNAPELPGGYAALLVPALIPPLWKALVHPRLDLWEKNQKSA
jgi:alkane 1-monooxygenase